jgi:hypothetical protein
MLMTNLIDASLLGYIDPGAGSMLLQLAIAGALGGLYTARQYLRQLLQGLTRTAK